MNPSDRIHTVFLPGRVVQLVTCLTSDMCLTADPGDVSSIPAWSHTFVEIDHEIISTKECDRAGIKLVIPGSAVRHVTNYATPLGTQYI